MDIRAIYKKDSFSRLCVLAGVREDFSEAIEPILTKAFSRLCVMDSRRWIRFLVEYLPQLNELDFNTLSPIEKRMMQMLYVSVWGKAAEDWKSDEMFTVHIPGISFWWRWIS